MLLPKKQEEISIRLDSLIAILLAAKIKINNRLGKRFEGREQLQCIRKRVENALFVCNLVRISLRQYAEPITEEDLDRNNIEELFKKLSQL